MSLVKQAASPHLNSEQGFVVAVTMMNGAVFRGPYDFKTGAILVGPNEVPTYPNDRQIFKIEILFG